MDGIASERVDQAIGDLIDLAIEHTLQESCTAAEAARIRLALTYPSPEISEAVNEVIGLVIEALDSSVPALLDAVLYPDD